MKITIGTILSDTEYPPLPGNEYEVGEGKLVKLRRPTYELRDAFLKALDTEENGDVEAARLVTEGEWPETAECYPSVVSRICEDFFQAATPTLRENSPLRR